MITVITDLHETGDFVSTDHAVGMLSRLPAPDFLVFSGDILYYDYGYGTRWSTSKCDAAIATAEAVVSRLGFPFMFTLGNHDATRHVCRSRLADALQAHPLHIGTCLRGRATCVHPTLPLATIDAALRNCRGDMASLGCPTEADDEWIGSRAAGGIIFTHYPPPDVLGRAVLGITGEAPNCWRQPKGAALPPHSVQAFGHDHDNMYVSEDGALVALFKSGVHSYGPAFAPGPGVTSFDARFVPTFHGGGGTVWATNNLPRVHVASECVNVDPRFIDSPWFVELVTLSVFVAASVAYALVKRWKRRPLKPSTEVDDILLESARPAY
jgi:hypothetical protein